MKAIPRYPHGFSMAWLVIASLFVGCSTSNPFLDPDATVDGTFEVERVLQSFPDYTGPKSCLFIYGLTNCPGYMEQGNARVVEALGESAGAELIAETFPANLAISDQVATVLGWDICYFEDSMLKDLRLVPFGTDLKPFVRDGKNEFPGQFINDSIKFYGNCYFAGLDAWSLLLKEKWVIQSGKLVSKEILGMEFGLNSKSGNRFHSFAKVEMENWDHFLNQPLEDPFLSLGFPDTLLASEYPYQSLSLQSTYDQNLLFLFPHSIDGNRLLPEEAYQLLKTSAYFRPTVPDPQKLVGQLWTSTRFFNPEFAFNKSEAQLATEIKAGTLNLEKQLEGILGNFTVGKSYDENILLSCKAIDFFTSELRNYLETRKMVFYHPDSLIFRRGDSLGLRDFQERAKRIMPGPYGFELEFIMGLKLNKGHVEKELSHMRLVIHDKEEIRPDRNFLVMDCRDLAPIFSEPLPGTDIPLGTFFEDYAFFEVYNLNGKGARTHEDAKAYLNLFEPLHPKPIAP